MTKNALLIGSVAGTFAIIGIVFSIFFFLKNDKLESDIVRLQNTNSVLTRKYDSIRKVYKIEISNEDFKKDSIARLLNIERTKADTTY